MCIFEDLQELPFKFQYTETQKQISILKLKSWEVYVEDISGCISLPALSVWLLTKKCKCLNGCFFFLPHA